MAVQLQQNPYMHGGVGLGFQPVMAGSEITASGSPDFGANDAAYQRTQQARYKALTARDLYGPQNPYLVGPGNPGSVQDPSSKTWYAPGHPQFEDAKQRAQDYASGATQSRIAAANANATGTASDQQRAFSTAIPEAGMASLKGLKQAAQAEPDGVDLQAGEIEQEAAQYQQSQAVAPRQAIGTRTLPQASMSLAALRRIY